MGPRWILGLLIACGGVQPSSGSDAGDLGELAWLVGAWTDGTVTESWASPERGAMQGTMTIVKAGAQVFSEAMRIEAAEGSVTMFVLLNQRAGGVPFRRIEQGSRRAVFENPENEFPRRMTYARDADALVIRLEGGAQVEVLRLAPKR